MKLIDEIVSVFRGAGMDDLHEHQLEQIEDAIGRDRRRFVRWCSGVEASVLLWVDEHPEQLISEVAHAMGEVSAIKIEYIHKAIRSLGENGDLRKIARG